jgi:hypothetical protein
LAGRWASVCIASGGKVTMGLFTRRNTTTESADIATQAATSVDGGRLAVLVSAVALAFSGYSLWETSLKAADVRAFVPPVIQFAAPYQNSNFEMIAVPITLTNEGARSATVLSLELSVTDPRSNQTKRFYAADFGRWTMEKTRSGAYEPFAPISLPGRTSRTESVLFYTRGEDEKPAELIRKPGAYNFALSIDLAESDKSPEVAFERSLLHYDARAFHEGTLPLYSSDWQASTNSAPE